MATPRGLGTSESCIGGHDNAACAHVKKIWRMRMGRSPGKLPSCRRGPSIPETSFERAITRWQDGRTRFSPACGAFPSTLSAWQGDVDRMLRQLQVLAKGVEQN